MNEGFSMIPAMHVEIFRKHRELDHRLKTGRTVFLSEMERLLTRARRCTTGRRETIRSIKHTWENRVRYTKRNGGRGLKWHWLDPSPTVFK